MVHEQDGSAGAAWIDRLEAPIRSAAAGPRGPLAALRFAVKDNIDVEGIPTTAGCPAFARVAKAHAHVVQRLLDAGAELVGKTNLDQFACGLSGTRSPYGAVPNSFNARYVSGGSSSGSAFVVATGQVDFALGTDTAGSGRVPAGLNNIVGLKPSRGLVSTSGVVPAAQSLDCVSIFARTVGLAVRVLKASMGFDTADPYGRALQLAVDPFPAHFRFGVPAQLEFFGDSATADEFAAAVVRLEAMGGKRVAIDYAPLAAVARLLYDSALVAERYAAVRAFFDRHPEEVIEPVRSILANGQSYGAADLIEAQTRLRQLAQQVEPLWKTIDLLFLPTAPTHYTIEAMQADPVALNRNLGAYTNFVNLLDYAAISVPSSLRPDGLPFGVTFVGRCGSDLQLAELAQRYHHGTALSLGATDERLPDPVAVFGASATEAASIRIAVVGAHLSGMPLNAQLTSRGAGLIATTSTAPLYRLYALPDSTPPKPGLVRVGPGEGAAIEVEVWEMPMPHFGGFVAQIPSPLGIGTLMLADGSAVKGFVCEPHALGNAEDITQYGGWRRYASAICDPTN